MKLINFEGGRYVSFVCPGCNYDHVIPVKNHPNAWNFNNDFDKPTLTPSIFVNRGGINKRTPICHSFVTNGQIMFLNDCTHDLAGKTVNLPEVVE